MAWRTLCCQEEIWVLLRENVVLPQNQIQEEIALEASLSQGAKEQGRGLCRGVLDIRLFWRKEEICHSMLGGEEGEEAWVRQNFFAASFDGGRKALACPPPPFGVSRFEGFLWQGQKIREEPGEEKALPELERGISGPVILPGFGAPPQAGGEGEWQKERIRLHWQAPWLPKARPEESELVCLHGVRTGLRTVLLEALIRIPLAQEEERESFWQGQEEIILELEEDAVKEILGVGFSDGMSMAGYDRDTGSLQMEWMSRLAVFYLREPSGGGRIGMAVVPYKKTAAFPGPERLNQAPVLLPLRRDVQVQVLRPDRLLCRFGLYLQKERQGEE